MARRAGTAAIVLAVSVVFGTASCELLFMSSSTEPAPIDVFDEAWTFTKTHYSFFDLKGVDWDDVYADYRPLVRSDMTDFELFDLLAQMLALLRDGHVNLQSPFDFSRYWEWFLGYPANFDPELLEREYYAGAQEYVGPFVVLDFGDVVYARYASFVGAVSPGHLDYLFTRYAESDGFILDVRGNGGGASSNAYRIAERLVSGPDVRGYQEYKNGPGPDDFSPRYDMVIAPPEGAVLWLKPFVVLTNRSSYSATNTFVSLVKGLDHVRVIGDTTGGGGGIPTFTELSNGWLLRVSAHRSFIPDGVGGFHNTELGIAPDDAVDMDPIDADAGEDTIIETALAYIRGL